MSKPFAITIGRQYGSGGHDIGKLLAQRLQVPCYDREILQEAAKDGQISEEVLQQFDEKPTNSFLYSLVMSVRAGKASREEYEMALPEKVFLSELGTIKKIAAEQSCIFVGRCADYALREHSRCLNLFVYAPLETRIQRIEQRQKIDSKKAAELIGRVDKRRASYYNYHTPKVWGDINSYHLCIDSSVCGIEGTVDVIEQLLKDRHFQ